GASSTLRRHFALFIAVAYFISSVGEKSHEVDCRTALHRVDIIEAVVTCTWRDHVALTGGALGEESQWFVSFQQARPICVQYRSFATQEPRFGYNPGVAA